MVFEILTLKTDSLKTVTRKLPLVVVPEIPEPDRVRFTSAPRLWLVDEFRMGIIKIKK